jgi:hypothetical protein
MRPTSTHPKLIPFEGGPLVLCNLLALLEGGVALALELSANARDSVHKAIHKIRRGLQAVIVAPLSGCTAVHVAKKQLLCHAFVTFARELDFGEYGVAIIDIVLNDTCALARELQRIHPWMRIAHVKLLVPAIDNKPS